MIVVWLERGTWLAATDLQAVFYAGPAVLLYAVTGGVAMARHRTGRRGAR